MTAPSPEPRIRQLTPAKGFAAVFLAVFLLILGGSALVTFLMPKTYRAVARVRLPTPQEMAAFQSDEVLVAAADRLHLGQSLAERYGDKESVAKGRGMELLRRSLRVVPIRNTQLVEVQVHNPDPREAADWANTIATAGVEVLAGRPSQTVDKPAVLDIAMPAQKPARPNLALNLALGALVGAFLGIMAGGVGARLAVGYDRESAVRNAPPGAGGEPGAGKD